MGHAAVLHLGQVAPAVLSPGEEVDVLEAILPTLQPQALVSDQLQKSFRYSVVIVWIYQQTVV